MLTSASFNIRNYCCGPYRNTDPLMRAEFWLGAIKGKARSKHVLSVHALNAVATLAMNIMKDSSIIYFIHNNKKR